MGTLFLSLLALINTLQTIRKVLLQRNVLRYGIWLLHQLRRLLTTGREHTDMIGSEHSRTTHGVVVYRAVHGDNEHLPKCQLTLYRCEHARFPIR